MMYQGRYRKYSEYIEITLAASGLQQQLCCGLLGCGNRRPTPEHSTLAPSTVLYYGSSGRVPVISPQ
jgi:hypothetical protein